MNKIIFVSQPDTIQGATYGLKNYTNAHIKKILTQCENTIAFYLIEQDSKDKWLQKVSKQSKIIFDWIESKKYKIMNFLRKSDKIIKEETTVTDKVAEESIYIVLFCSNTLQKFIEKIERLKEQFPDEFGHMNFDLEKETLQTGVHIIMDKKTYEKAKKKRSRGCSRKGIALRCIFDTLINKEKSEHSSETCGGCSKKEEQEMLTREVKKEKESQEAEAKLTLDNKPELSPDEIKEMVSLKGGALSNNNSNNSKNMDLSQFGGKSYEQMLLIKKTYEIQKEQAEKELLVINQSKKNEVSYDLEFQEEVMFFQARDRLLVEFTKFIMHVVSIPIRVNNLFIQKKKLNRKLDEDIDKLTNKYTIVNLEKDKKNEVLIMFLREHRSDLDAQEKIKKY